jgi:hypothetical protein
MAGCEYDFSSLPILTNCPGPNEQFLVGNAVGGIDSNGNYTVGYARRTWAGMLVCVFQSLNWIYTQFKIGVGSSPLTQGQSFLAINAPNYLSDSLSIFLNGNLLPRNDGTQISYTYSYISSQLLITFNQGAINGQQYTVIYANS